MTVQDCILCQIVGGNAPASSVYENDTVLALMTLEQPNPYKVIVISKRHVETLFDLDEDLAAALFQATVRVANAIRRASGCPGLNLVQSNGRAGQQDIFHFHLHLLPRFEGDGILLRWDNTPQERVVLDELAAAIRSELES